MFMGVVLERRMMGPLNSKYKGYIFSQDNYRWILMTYMERSNFFFLIWQDSFSLCYFLFCWNWQNGYRHIVVVEFHLQFHNYISFTCFFCVGCGFIYIECQICLGFFLIYWKVISLLMWVNQSQVWQVKHV